MNQSDYDAELEQRIFDLLYVPHDTNLPQQIDNRREYIIQKRLKALASEIIRLQDRLEALEKGGA